MVLLAVLVLGMVTAWCPEKFDSVALTQEQILLDCLAIKVFWLSQTS